MAEKAGVAGHVKQSTGLYIPLDLGAGPLWDAEGAIQFNLDNSRRNLARVWHVRVEQIQAEAEMREEEYRREAHGWPKGGSTPCL